MMADSSKLFGRTRRVSTTMQERIRRFEVSNSSSEAMEISGHGLKDEKKDKFEDTERHRQNARVTEIATDHEHEHHKPVGHVQRTSKFMQVMVSRYEDPKSSTQPLKLSYHAVEEAVSRDTSSTDSRVVDQLTYEINPVEFSSTYDRDLEKEQGVSRLSTEKALAGVSGEIENGNDLKATNSHDSEVTCVRQHTDELEVSQRIIEEQTKTISELEGRIRDLDFRNESLREEINSHQAQVTLQDDVGSMESTKLQTELREQVRKLEMSETERQSELIEAKGLIHHLLERESSLEYALRELTAAMAKLEGDVIALINEIERQGELEVVHVEKSDNRLQVAWI